MVRSLAEYSLSDGYVHNWLVAGPRVVPSDAVMATPDWPPEEASKSVTETLRFQLGPDTLTWRYAKAAADHLVDVSGWLRSPGHLEAWACCLLASTIAEVVEAAVIAYAPPVIEVGETRVAPYAGPNSADCAAAPGQPGRWHFRLPLQATRNSVTVRFTRLPDENSPTAFALHLLPGAASPKRAPLRVLIPLNLAPALLRDREVFEAVLEAAYLDRDVYLHGERVNLKWGAAYDNWVRLTARLQTPAGLIFAEAFDVQTAPGRPIQKPATLVDGAYEVLVLPNTREYHDETRLRVSRALPLFISETAFAEDASGTPEGRRLEALKHAARHKHDLFAELAKIVAGAWSTVDARVIQATIDQVTQRPRQHLAQLVGLVGLRHRYANQGDFPHDLVAVLDAGLASVDYTFTPALAEGDELLLFVAEVLAGQLYPEQPFASDGQTGHWHQRRGEQAARVWLQQRGAWGLQMWDSAGTIEAVVVGLTHLVALADNDDLAGLASVLLDKVFFGLALNSFKGTFGAAQRQTCTAAVLTGRLAATASLSWLLWGQGTLNQHLAGLVSLTANPEYQLPQLIAAIAALQPEAILQRAAHGSDDLVAHTITYKTPDFMLSSVYDYRPSSRGDCEHIWQATLGPDALVFTSQPANLSLSDLHRPNFWRGNVSLPRVAQWRDALIAIYLEPPTGEGLGFTHAHFPVYAFDEHARVEGWAFARRGNGYVAVTAKNGLALQTTGDAAQRELRSPGGTNVWLCQLGRAETDGTFAEFQACVLDQLIHWGDQGVNWNTVRGDALTWGLDGSLLVNDRAEAMGGPAHYDNPYTNTPRGAAQMDIVHDGQGLRLNFDETTSGA